MKHLSDEKTAILLLCAVLLIVSAGLVPLGSANWIFLPQSPNTDPPTLTVQSPVENGTYEGSADLNISVTKPDSWNSTFYDPNIVGGILYINYCLDGQTASLFECQFCNPVPNDDLPSTSLQTKTLTGLCNGTHTLNVTVYAQTQYAPNRSPSSPKGPDVSVEPFILYNMTVNSETINFIVMSSILPSPSPTAPSPSLSPSPTATPNLNSSPSPSPSATLNPTATTELTPTPTPTATPTSEPQPASSGFLLLGGVVTAIAAVAALIASVALFRRKGLC